MNLFTPTNDMPTESPSPVRVCFLIDRLDRAGTESQLLALIRVLDRDQVSPSLVLLDGTDPVSRSLEPSNCPILRLGLKRIADAKAVSAAWKLKRFWHEQRVDVLAVYFLDSAYFGIPLAKLCGIPRIIRVRNNLGYWLQGSHRILSKITGRIADVTLTNTQLGRVAIQRSEGLPARRVAVIGNGVDIDRFNPFPLPFSDDSDREVRVGCVANLRKVKNIDGFIRAARKVADVVPNVKFEVAGEGVERDKLERLIDRLDLRDVFHLRGATTNVPEFLRGIDIAVLPSHSEGMSNAILEYMAAGRVIVATNVGANAELLGSEGGIIVPPGSDDHLAEAIIALATNQDLAQRCGVEARRRAEIEFSRDAMRLRFENFFREPLANCG